VTQITTLHINVRETCAVHFTNYSKKKSITRTWPSVSA